MKGMDKSRFSGIFIILILLFKTVIVSGQGLPFTSPEKVGLSSDRLSRIGTVMNEWVAAGKMPEW
jgi:hypothetical protein